MKKELKIKAKNLRKEGKSLRDIAKLLNVSKSTASLWIRSVKISEEDRKKLERMRGFGGSEALRKKCKKLRDQHQQEGRLQAKKGDLQHLIGCILYWGEGTKSRNSAILANTDTNVICVFKKFVDKYFPGQKYSIHINCYLNNGLSQKDIEDHWLNLLQLERNSLKKCIFKKSGEGYRKNRHKFGVCSLRAGNTHVVQHIYGAIQEYCGFENEDWIK